MLGCGDIPECPLLPGPPCRRLCLQCQSRAHSARKAVPRTGGRRLPHPVPTRCRHPGLPLHRVRPTPCWPGPCGHVRGVWHQAGAELADRSRRARQERPGLDSAWKGGRGRYRPHRATRIVGFPGTEGALGLSPDPHNFLSPHISLSRVVTVSVSSNRAWQSGAVPPARAPPPGSTHSTLRVSKSGGHVCATLPPK